MQLNRSVWYLEVTPTTVKPLKENAKETTQDISMGSDLFEYDI